MELVAAYEPPRRVQQGQLAAAVVMVRGPEQLEGGFGASLVMGAVLVAAEVDPGPALPGRGAGRGGEGQVAEHTEKAKMATVPE
jgi:hypothetical protein